MGFGGGFSSGLWGCQDVGLCCGASGVGTRLGRAHLWKTTASTVMAASRRKAKAPRMDPIIKESLSGSWVDSSPEEAASQDHTWARPHKHVHLHTLPCTKGQLVSHDTVLMASYPHGL